MSESTEWNREKCLQLIDQYEKYPILWNAKHGLYNKVKKNDAWQIIDAIMECSKVKESPVAKKRNVIAKGSCTGTQAILRSMTTSQSTGQGQSFKKCNWEGRCQSKKCACRKENIFWNSKCHNSSTCAKK
nr:unnamed protein product [Callosobruchus chinensis]